MNWASHWHYNCNFQNPVPDFPAGPVAKTPCSQCRQQGFDLWSGKILCVLAKKKGIQSQYWSSAYLLWPFRRWEICSKSPSKLYHFPLIFWDFYNLHFLFSWCKLCRAFIRCHIYTLLIIIIVSLTTKLFSYLISQWLIFHTYHHLWPPGVIWISMMVAHDIGYHSPLS